MIFFYPNIFLTYTFEIVILAQLFSIAFFKRLKRETRYIIIINSNINNWNDTLFMISTWLYEPTFIQPACSRSWYPKDPSNGLMNLNYLFIHFLEVFSVKVIYPFLIIQFSKFQCIISVVVDVFIQWDEWKANTWTNQKIGTVP